MRDMQTRRGYVVYLHKLHIPPSIYFASHINKNNNAKHAGLGFVA